MQKVRLALLLLLMGTQAHAATYNCQNESGETATLNLRSSRKQTSFHDDLGILFQCVRAENESQQNVTDPQLPAEYQRRNPRRRKDGAIVWQSDRGECVTYPQGKRDRPGSIELDVMPCPTEQLQPGNILLNQ